jgi:hypothetical protein
MNYIVQIIDDPLKRRCGYNACYSSVLAGMITFYCALKAAGPDFRRYSISKTLKSVLRDFVSEVDHTEPDVAVSRYWPEGFYKWQLEDDMTIPAPFWL